MKELVKKVIRKAVILCGFHREDPQVQAKLNTQNLWMGMTLMIIDAVTAIGRMPGAYAEGVKDGSWTLFEVRTLFIYGMMLFGSLLMGWTFWQNEKKKLKNPLIGSIAVLIFIMNQLCYGFQMSVDLIDNTFLLAFFPFCIAAIWSFILFNVRPWITVLLSLGFYVMIDHWLIANNNMANSAGVKMMMLSLWLVSFIRYHNSRVAAISNVHEKALNQKLNDMNAQLQQVNERLKETSIRDALTGLKNRFGLREDFEGYMGKKVFMMITDVDDFKNINDSMGHDVGDQVLRAYANGLVEVFGEKCCYRYGGDEFLVIDEYDEDKGMEMQEKYAAMLEQLHIADMEGRLRCSGGFLIVDCNDGEAFRNGIKQADHNLYAAKQKGKDRVVGAEVLSF